MRLVAKRTRLVANRTRLLLRQVKTLNFPALDVSYEFSGHVDELWGLAAHPNVPQFVTAGWDRLLQLWDGLSHSTVWSKDIEVRILRLNLHLALYSF